MKQRFINPTGSSVENVQYGSLEEILNILKKIKSMGYVKTHRPDDQGVGRTLEDLLGVPENNFLIRDLGDIELKAKRVESESMLSVASATPKPRGVSRVLFNTYKFMSSKGYYCLYSDVTGAQVNPQGFRIALGENILILDNPKHVNAYWPFSIFEDSLKAKGDRILLVFAETKGERKTVEESFNYVEAYLLEGLSWSRFKNAILNGKLKIEFRIGVYLSGKLKGKYHDHGTAFRIMKRDFLHLYDTYKQIL
jgi:hypothetical protein